jgi:hypothetical protein
MMKQPNRTTKFASAITCVFLAVTAFTPMRAFSQAPAADGTNTRVNDALKRAAKYLVSAQDVKTGAIIDVTKGGNQTAMTSLGLLALSAMGHQPGDATPEGETMKRALDFVLKAENQEKDGYFGQKDGSRMYGHGITTLMLAEMLGMGADEKQDAIIRERCRKGVELILKAQRVRKSEENAGGWRYDPGATDSDMSITCWQTMALRAAKNAGLDVPKESVDLAARYIKKLHDKSQKAQGIGGFGYASVGHEPSTTAEGLLALQVCGDYECEEVKLASELLFKTPPKTGDSWFHYTTYYYAQGMYQRGGKYEPEGKKVIANVVLPGQARDGSWEGPGNEAGHGKIYSTSLAVLALAVKNHYLPIYQR